MRILILADIHGNMPALEAIIREESWDLMICLGDLVDYGPWPDEVVDFIIENADYTVMGNHDYSLTFDGDCGCSPEYVDLTLYSRNATLSKINEVMKSYLASLPKKLLLELDNNKFHLVHGSIKNPLYGWVAPGLDEEKIRKEMYGVEGIVLFGHSHMGMYRKLEENLIIVNPGSVGFPKGEGDPRASYIIYENGKFHQKKVFYNIDRTVQGIVAMDMPDEIKNILISNLLKGR